MSTAPSPAWEDLRTAANLVVMRAEQLRNGRPMPPEIAALERALEELAADGLVALSAAQTALAVEALARDIYDEWKAEPGFVPWVEGGNSHRQDEARMLARAALDDGLFAAPQQTARNGAKQE